MQERSAQISAIIVGAGPAGLTAAHDLAKAGARVVVLEADPHSVGGIARTLELDGFRFDIGGHRFFTKSRAVEEFWTSLLPDDLLTRRRSSRIFYRGKFYSYPLRTGETLRQLGFRESARCVLSYLRARARPRRRARNVEEWVSRRFGRRLFRIFFETYTEKVWGMPCSRIAADWAAQRIQGLSLGKAVFHSLLPVQKRPKTLAETFLYPRLGPGMLWEACAERVRALGGTILLGCRATAFEHGPDGWLVRYVDRDGRTHELRAAHLVSTASLADLAPRISPPLPAPALDAVSRLRYRDFVMVGVALEGPELFADNWLYIHEPRVRVGRIQNFRSWSPELLPDPALGSYGMEYFCNEGDDLWRLPDGELRALALRELAELGLLGAQKVRAVHVIRQRKAYPVYHASYADDIHALRGGIAAAVKNLHLIGRNGMHRYNNQDHAVMTGMLAAKNILAGREVYDVWRVNQDAEYLE
jgi:protoporphyrinogen oxidase